MKRRIVFEDNYSEAAAFAGITFSQGCQFDLYMKHLLGKLPAPGELPDAMFEDVYE